MNGKLKVLESPLHKQGTGDTNEDEATGGFIFMIKCWQRRAASGTNRNQHGSGTKHLKGVNSGTLRHRSQDLR